MTACAYCGSELNSLGTRGPKRQYCSGRCRQAASRERQAVTHVDWKPAELKTVAPAPPSPKREVSIFNELAGVAVRRPQSAQELVAQALSDAHALVGVLRRASEMKTDGLSWRCQELADSIHQELVRLFGDVNG
jgi:hypothetical protein